MNRLILHLFWAGVISLSFPWTRAAATNAVHSTDVPAAERIVLPEPIPDPLERLNRGLWAVNEAAMKGVVKPSGKAYRFFVPVPFRIGLSNVGRNLSYPRRVVNNLLQERWSGARDESYRFLCNTVLGMGGFLDVATEFRIPLSEADFAQTFGKWGWGQNFYLMLPLAGPSSDREAAGAVADWASNPLTYFSPYNYIPTAITYNNLTDAVDGYVRRIESEMDPYSLLRYVSALQRKQRPVDWKITGEQHAPSLETMQFALFGVRDARFPEQGETRAVKSAAGKQLPYTVWLQPKPAPIAYILPGIGAHRLNAGAVALAELLYDQGYSAVTISSAFNYEFIDRGLSTDLPGYGPRDVQDVHAALTGIDRDLSRVHPGRLGQRALIGYSLGGFHTLMLAARAPENPSLLQFERYVSIDAPVRLLHGIEQLDSFYRAALEWPADQRTDKIENLLMKVAHLVEGDAAAQQQAIPLSATESRFLIGLAFRLNLRDVIFFTQLRHNQGVLQQPLDKWKREPVYREIMNYSFSDYVNLFVTPYYAERGIDLTNPQTLARAVDLKTLETAFRSQPSIRAIANEDDILLAPEDVQWLSATFGDRVTLFPRGGHLGNLGETAVQAALFHALGDLSEMPRREVISSPRTVIRQSPRDYTARGSRAGF